ncbi:unnamed protein product [Colias eurytheme]|nr:unnamed protein product [Colias eurytheme]
MQCSDSKIRPISPGSRSNINVAKRGTTELRANKDANTCGSSCISRSDLRSIIKEELRMSVTNCIADFKSDINNQLCEMKDDIRNFHESISFMNSHFENLNAEIKSYKIDIERIKKENELLKSELSTISARCIQLDQLMRSSNLEVQCVPEHKSENLITVVKQLSKVVACPINDTDISYCSRIAKKDPKSLRPRAILVRLSSPRLRDAFLAATVKYNKQNPDNKLNSSLLGLGGNKKSAIYVTENLSPENKALHAAARLKARELNYKHVWVRSGRIFMRKTDTSEYIHVRSAGTLDSLCNQ